MQKQCEKCLTFSKKHLYSLFCCKSQYCKTCLSEVKVNNFKCLKCGVKLYFVKKISVIKVIPTETEQISNCGMGADKMIKERE
jgi:hypothetical protein